MPPFTESELQVLDRAIAHRRSLGLSRLKSDPVPDEMIQRMLEAANWAPSHGDTEPWRFNVYRGEAREVLADIFEQAYRADHKDNFDERALAGFRERAFDAPVWISLGMVPGLREDGTLKMSEEDEILAVACAVQNLHLMASALGLAGMWHSKGLSINPAVARRLGLESPSRLLGFFFCGFPGVDWPEGERRPLSEKLAWINPKR